MWLGVGVGVVERSGGMMIPWGRHRGGTRTGACLVLGVFWESSGGAGFYLALG
jgi:hypothetical protein